MQHALHHRLVTMHPPVQGTVTNSALFDAGVTVRPLSSVDMTEGVFRVLSACNGVLTVGVRSVIAVRHNSASIDYQAAAIGAEA